MFDALVATFMHPDEEFTELVSTTMASDVLSNTHDNSSGDCSINSNTALQAWATLNSLLHSSKLLCRLHGYCWLADILTREIAHGSINIFDSGVQQQVSTSSINKDADASGILVAVRLLYGLLRSRHALVRRGFTAVLERILVCCQKLAMSNSAVHSPEVEGKENESKLKAGENWESRILDLMNGALLHFVSANDPNHINILQVVSCVLANWHLLLHA